MTLGFAIPLYFLSDVGEYCECARFEFFQKRFASYQRMNFCETCRNFGPHDVLMFLRIVFCEFKTIHCRELSRLRDSEHVSDQSQTISRFKALCSHGLHKEFPKM